MNKTKLMFLGLVAGMISACTDPTAVTRDDANPRQITEPAAKVLINPVAEPNQADRPSDFRVEAVRVHVAPELVVSESNGYYPGVDIVWRGDPLGDRHQQVRDIFHMAFARGTDGLDGPQPIELHVDVRRFHALTERARYTVGGVHAITFALQKRDALSGVAIGPAKLIRADLRAYGGQAALVAESQGQTQKVRITEHLSDVIRTELTATGGYQNQRLGLLQVLNQL